MSTDNTPLPGVPDRLETVRMDALSEAAKSGNRSVLEMHRAIANRLIREGAPARAFSELVRATREVPMSARLAAALAHIALKAGTLPAAVTLLTQGLDEVDGAERAGVRHALARMYRRSDDLELAREQLVVLLAENPTDRRARLTLNALLEREERWDELDASLEKETREELRRGTLRRASRSALKRARLWGERLDNPARASLRYGQAAQFAEQAQDFESAFLLRLLWLRSLHKSNAPERAVKEAIEAAMRVAERVGKTDRVRHMVHELELSGEALPVQTDVSVAVVTEGKVPTGAAVKPYVPARRSSTQIELMSVAAEAEKQGKAPVVAALLRAAVDENQDPQALKRLEAHFVARGAWRELAQFYSDTSLKVSSQAEKAQWKEKLAELLESELDDPMGAARAWAEVVELTGDQRAVKEQVRLHSERKDAKGVRRALDEGVTRATTAQARADARVARADEALTRKDVEAATADLQAALTEVPQHPAALAGLAELAAAEGDSHYLPQLQRALEKVPRRRPGRGELHRRLGRLADLNARDAVLARRSWAEVLLELPDDEEAQTRLSLLAREGGDSGDLEAALRAQLAKEPRGGKARPARIELVALLEANDRSEDALNELRQAVRYEPGHQEAWLALADRLEQRGIWQEAAWALEHAATATSNGAVRMQLWLRLSRFASDRLDDPEKAEQYEKRAEKLRRELLDEAEQLPVGPLAGPLTVPPPRGSRPPLQSEATPADADFEMLARLLKAVAEPETAVPPPRPTPNRRGGVPHAALEMLRGLARAPALPWAEDEQTEGRGRVPTDLPSEGRAGARSSPRSNPPAPGLDARSGRSTVPLAGADGRAELKSNPRTPAVSGESRAEPHSNLRTPGLAGDSRADVKSNPRMPAVPADSRAEVKSNPRTPAISADSRAEPKSTRTPGVDSRPELKSNPRASAVPPGARPSASAGESQRKLAPIGDARPEPRATARGAAVPVIDTGSELKGNARGYPVPTPPEDLKGSRAPRELGRPGPIPPTGSRIPAITGLEGRPELKGSGRGMPISAPRPDLKGSTPGARIPAVEPRQQPAIALRPRGGGPELPPAVPSPATQPPPLALEETKNLRIPQVPVEDSDDDWEGSTVGRLEDDDQEVSVEEAMSGTDDLIELGTSDVEPPSEDWEAPPGVVSSEAVEPVEYEPPLRPVTQELPSHELGDPAEPLSPSFGLSPSKLLSEERVLLFERVRGAPLEPDGYKLLAEHFDAGGDPTRSSLMLEIALALEGDPHAAPRAPRLILSATDRAGLKHPVLRNEEGELLGLCGLALCRIYPTRGPEAGSREEFRMDAGKGARGAADALLTAVRILGLRAPDVYPSNDNGPPFALVFPGAPRLLVGRLAIKRELPEAELRFFAGRALFTQNPDLLALRNLRREQLVRSLSVLGQVLRGQAMSAEARAVRDGLPPKGWERLKQLYERVSRNMNLPVLSEGARHSANRAGLVVCGGVAPALAALRAKKALESEMVELVRFAASERYLVLRSRKLGK